MIFDMKNKSFFFDYIDFKNSNLSNYDIFIFLIGLEKCY